MTGDFYRQLYEMSFPNAVIGNPVIDFVESVRIIFCHSRENGNPLEIISFRSRYDGKWIPAFAGMTGIFLSSTFMKCHSRMR
jgi:hypothetical protein